MQAALFVLTLVAVCTSHLCISRFLALSHSLARTPTLILTLTPTLTLTLTLTPTVSLSLSVFLTHTLSLALALSHAGAVVRADAGTQRQDTGGAGRQPGHAPPLLAFFSLKRLFYLKHAPPFYSTTHFSSRSQFKVSWSH